MITVRCICSNKLEVPTDLAGDSIQCPVCGHLVDVPLLSELDAIDEDGAYRISQEPAPEPHRLAELARIYAPGRKDAQGKEIDLRTAPGPRVAPAQVASTGLEASRPTPIYDPDTGKRIEPLDLSRSADPLPHEIPMAQMNLSYATAGMAKPHLSLFRILLELLHPVNLFVMSFLLAGHYLLSLGFRFSNAGSWRLEIARYFLVTPFLLAILGHYGVVIEEIGIEEKSELPRPFRNASIWEDMLLPGYRVLRAILICFLPAMIYWYTPARIIPNMPAVIFTLTALGIIFFPMVLVLSTTASPWKNYLPRQLLRLITHNGLRYLGAVLLSAICYLLVLWMHGKASPMLLPDIWLDAVISIHLKWPLIIFADLGLMVYLLHALVFHMGTLYHQLMEVILWTRLTDPRQPIAPPAPAHPPVPQVSATGKY